MNPLWFWEEYVQTAEYGYVLDENKLYPVKSRRYLREWHPWYFIKPRHWLSHYEPN